MGLFATIAIFVVSTAISWILRPKVRRPDAPDLDFPKAEAGIPVPVVYGTQAVSPIIVAVGDIGKHDNDVGGKFYEGLVIGKLCLGPIDELVDIQFGGKSIRLHPFTKEDSTGGSGSQTVSIVTGTAHDPALPYTFGDSPVTFNVNARQLFGGQESEGGVEGHIRVYQGASTQAVDPVMTRLWQLAGLSGNGTGHPHTAYAVFGEVGTEFYWGTVASPKTPTFIVKCIPNNLGLGVIGENANPAEMLFDLMGHELRGLGLDPTFWVDHDSFITVGQTLKAEGLGLSATWHTREEAADLKEDIERHIQGVCFQHPLTGKWTLALARQDYEAASLTEVNRSVASDLDVTRPGWEDTRNEIKLVYRRYDNTALEGASVTDEALTGDDGFQFTCSPNGTSCIGYYQAKGRNITSVTLTNVTKSTTLVEDTNYRLFPDVGFFWIYQEDGVVDEGDVLTVSYTNGSAFVGFKEDTVQAQDLASIQATGEVRSETYEYPFFTTELTAQKHASRLLKMESRPLMRATWTEHRLSDIPVVNDVRRVNWTSSTSPDFTVEDVPFRIVRVDYGTLTDGGIRVTAVEDVFGVDVHPAVRPPPGGDPPVRPQAPTIAISQAPTSAIRVCLFPSDENFTITLQRAEDSAFSVNLTTLSSSIAGDTEYYDDTITVGLTRYYRAKLTRTGYEDGDWSTTLAAVATAGTPGSCTCQEPGITATATRDSADPTSGTFTLTVANPSGLTVTVETRTRTGGAAFTDWTTQAADSTTGTTAFYEVALTLEDGVETVVEWRATYTDCAGDQVVATGSVTVPANNPTGEEPTPGLTEVPVEIVVFALPVNRRLTEVPAEATALDAWGGTQDKFPLTTFTSARIVATVTETDLPTGCYVAVQAENAAVEDDWHYLDGATGPSLAIGSGDITTGKAQAGEWVTIDENLRADVRLRGVIGSGDGSAVKMTRLPRVVLQLVAQDVGATPPPEHEEPPPDDPGSCDTPTALDMDTGWTGGDETGVAWSNLTDSTATVTLDGTGSGSNYWEKQITGLTASEQHTVYLTVDTDAAGLGAEPFLQVVGGDTSVAEDAGGETLVARGDADGSGNLTLRWGIQEAGNVPSGAGSDDLDYANQGAAEAAGWTVTDTASAGGIDFDTGHAISGSGVATSIFVDGGDGTGRAQMEKTFSVTNGQNYEVGLWVESSGAPWWQFIALELASGSNSGSANLNGGAAAQEMTASVTADGTSLTVRFYVDAVSFGSGFYASALTISGLAGGGAVVDFDTLGYCEGSGIGDGGTGLGPGDPDDPDAPGDDPIPSPPPGGYPPPASGGTRPFGCYNLPAGGFAYWNSTIKAATVTNIVNLLDLAASVSGFVRLQMGSHGRTWLDASGRFKYELWEAEAEAIANDSRANTALAAAIASGVAWAHDVIDEPFHPTRYGGPIPFATVERMCQKSKELWPTWRTTIRVPPTKVEMVRHMVGLDTLFAQYHLKLGDVASYRDRQIARAEELGHSLILALHYVNFDGIHRSSSDGVVITPSQLRHYGGILASTASTTVVGFDGWCFVTRMWNQAGFPDALREVRDEFASHDP